MADKQRRAFPRKLLAFLRRDFRIARSYRLNFLSQVFGIIITTFSFFLISKMFTGQHPRSLEPYGGEYFPFVLIGIALSDFMGTVSSSFANEIRNGQVVGTLESLLVTPTPIGTILFSAFIYRLLGTFLRISFFFVLGIYLFNVSFPEVNLLALLLSFVLTLIPLVGLGLMSAGFILVFKQGNPIGGLLGLSSGLLGGVVYPLSVLPAWLRPLSDLLPITHGLEAIRLVLLKGVGVQEIRPQLDALFILAVFFLIGGGAALYWGLKIAKREGSLLHY